MNPRFRVVVPLAACLVLGGTLEWALRDMSSAPSPETSLAVPSASGLPSSVPGPSVPSPSVESGAATGPAPAASQALAAREEPPPESEEADSPPQENDPIEPEQPQTAAWRHEKLVRITQLLDRDVERLEAERQSASARGDETESRRLAVQLARHRVRLGSLREETAVMADAARQEEQAR
ncbi:hypothetical protein D187_002534 [Cystobacter fuscus DSM 2262]|uniref:Uncharacterized protein n=1 Tax=Cystobacter fuscus (strain ATCC 25194 / DSM 2262 / NBRC 100088 / M29) TaxID=1242864 RepID=S9P5Q2_CYSF2|nr:hypothetical protein [Cystobacter fuscus]EPX59790.1 hypothetical protein D187_002534 [Cystobacter fuscus DSM 2262]